MELPVLCYFKSTYEPEAEVHSDLRLALELDALRDQEPAEVQPDIAMTQAV